MFFRSKNGNATTQPGTGPAEAEEVAVAPPDAMPATTGPVAASAPAVDRALTPEELKRRAEVSQRLSTAIGELLLLMARVPGHRDRKLSDLLRLVLPAVRTGQHAVLHAPSRSRASIAPVAAVLWASVSPEVDKRLSETLGEPIRLAPKDWRSGDIVWLVETLGDGRGVAALVQRLRGKQWEDKRVKVRVKDTNGEVKVCLIAPPTVANDAAATPQQSEK